jgi:hypothetical protein
MTSKDLGTRWWIKSFLLVTLGMRRIRVTRERLNSEERKRGRVEETRKR